MSYIDAVLFIYKSLYGSLGGSSPLYGNHKYHNDTVMQVKTQLLWFDWHYYIIVILLLYGYFFLV
jgi:hypothetical protein